MIDRDGGRRAVAAKLEPGPQVVLAQIVGGEIAAEPRGLEPVMDIAASRQRPDQRHQEQEAADIGRDRIAGQPDDAHGAETAVHHRLAGPHRDLPERHGDAFGFQRLLDEVVVSHRGAAGGDENVGAAVAGAADAQRGRLDGVGRNAEIDGFGAFLAGQCAQRIAVGIDDLTGARGRARHYQLVAGGEDGNLRPPAYGKLRVIHAGGEREIAVSET